MRRFSILDLGFSISLASYRTLRAVPKSKIKNPQSKISVARWARIRLLALDVDGVLTDGTVEISSEGSESKKFSILDGMGLIRLGRAGVAVAWISGRASEATTVRAKELRIPHIIQGRTDKLLALQELAAALDLTSDAICYMGDDDIDAPAMDWASIGVAPFDAMPAALKAADFVPDRPPGRGAGRRSLRFRASREPTSSQ